MGNSRRQCLARRARWGATAASTSCRTRAGTSTGSSSARRSRATRRRPRRARAASDADAQRGRCARGARRLGRDERILRRRPPRSHLLHHRLTSPLPPLPRARIALVAGTTDSPRSARALEANPPASTDHARARAKSVNFFEAEEKALLKTKAEFDQHAGARLGGEKPGEVPWYARSRRSPSPDGVGAAAEGLGFRGTASMAAPPRGARRRRRKSADRKPRRAGDDDDDKAPRRSAGRAEPSSSDKIAKLRRGASREGGERTKAPAREGGVR